MMSVLSKSMSVHCVKGSCIRALKPFKSFLNVETFFGSVLRKLK